VTPSKRPVAGSKRKKASSESEESEESEDSEYDGGSGDDDDYEDDEFKVEAGLLLVCSIDSIRCHFSPPALRR
jgi:hypothetical protein